MIFVIVKDKTNAVIGRDVYSGDDDQNNAIIDKLKLTNPSLTYEVSDKATFEQTAITPIVTKAQTDWATAKKAGTDAALTFVAKQLGLE